MRLVKRPAMFAAVRRIFASVIGIAMLTSLAAQDRQPITAATPSESRAVQHATATTTVTSAPDSLIFSSGPMKPARLTGNVPAPNTQSQQAVTPVAHETSATEPRWTARTPIQIPTDTTPSVQPPKIRQTALDPVPVPPAAAKSTAPPAPQKKSPSAGPTQAQQPRTQQPSRPPSTVHHHRPPVYHPLPDRIYEPYRHSYHAVHRPNNWIQMDALVWWTSAVDVPALSTVSPAGTPPSLAGIVGPNSETLYGNEIHGDEQGGFRIRAGHGFGRADGRGWTAEFLTLLSRGTDFQVSSNGDPILARPFINVGAGTGFGGTPDAELTTFPGASRGLLSIQSETRLYGFGLHYWGELYDAGDNCDACHNSHSRCDDLHCESDCYACVDQCATAHSPTIFGIKVGPRFYHLDDDLQFDERFATNAGNQFALHDFFGTENSFLGAEVGLQSRLQKGRLSLNVGVQLAVGATRQELEIRGQNMAIVNGNLIQGNTGFYTQNSNSGSSDRTRFSVIPAFDLQLGWKLKSGWQANIGYQLMYWTNVLRAGEQVDPHLDPAFFGQPIQNPNQPTRLYHESDYVAHGLSFGIERRF